MNIFSQRRSGRRPGAAAFTLVEMMMVAAVFTVMIGGIVSVQIFAMRVYTLAATKLTATTDARETLNFMREQIRSSKVVVVGTFNNGAFVQAPNGTAQKGNALALANVNLNSSNYLVYYLDTSTETNMLYSVTNGVSTVMARFMTNYYCFYAEDYNNNILSNYVNNPVIHVVMQFDQWEYPIAFIGTNALNAYDFYMLQTRVSRRAKQ